jgi:outer membrane lipoprotein
MQFRFSRLLVFFLLIALPGCASVISQNLRDESDPALTFRQVSQNPDAYTGKMVIWGGEIIETTNQSDGKTLIELFQRPLGVRDEPRETLPSEGRFLVLAGDYLDPYEFRRGRKITVAGEILGHRTKPIGQMEYRYPLLSSKQIYLWPVYYYSYPMYPYGYYNPGWYYRPWYPWWGYPYGWGWGFRFHYRH